ncbi:MAG: helix-turn-helix domain-containing protein [Bryobacterales bacterium]|nr:helix-turn-helix domain-containing protein [Bryobacterales bacterium]
MARPDERRPLRHLRRPNEVGAALRAARERLGLAQAEVAAAAGVSRKWLSEAERGKAAMSLGLVLGVLDALGYEAEFVPRPDDFDLEAHLDRLGSTDGEFRW